MSQQAVPVALVQRLLDLQAAAPGILQPVRTPAVRALAEKFLALVPLPGQRARAEAVEVAEARAAPRTRTVASWAQPA